jgi:hypothetical protein
VCALFQRLHPRSRNPGSAPGFCAI